MAESTATSLSSDNKEASGVVEVENGDTAAARTDTVDSSKSQTEMPFEAMLSDSTHQFLFASKLKENGRDIHLGDKLVAILVLVAQCGLYLYLIDFVLQSADYLSNHLNVFVHKDDCDSLNEEATDYDILQCAHNDEDAAVWQPYFAALFLYLAFISSDIAAIMRLFKSGSLAAGITGGILLSEACLAAICISMIAIVGVNSSGANAILSVVGVMFVHELDNKVRAVYQYIPNYKQLFFLSSSSWEWLWSVLLEELLLWYSLLMITDLCLFNH